jgi:quinol monooxygenase YgiN
MIRLIVTIRVRPDSTEAWIAATLDNEAESRKEPGILAFDLFRDRDDPGRFVLVEDYRDDAAMAAHKETAHYLRWKSSTEPLQAAVRERTLCLPVTRS